MQTFLKNFGIIALLSKKVSEFFFEKLFQIIIIIKQILSYLGVFNSSYIPGHLLIEGLTFHDTIKLFTALLKLRDNEEIFLILVKL